MFYGGSFNCWLHGFGEGLHGWLQENAQGDALSALAKAESERARHRAYWRRRQDALPTNRIPDDLESHEIQFFEQFIAAGNSIRLIPRDNDIPPKSTNDFIWENNGQIEVEVKNVRRGKYDSIAREVRDAVSGAKTHDVTKNNFIVIQQWRPTAKLINQLARFNQRNPTNQISRLWIWQRMELVEVILK